MTIRFDHRMETANGFLLAAKFEPVHQQYEQANPTLKEGTKIMAQKFHSMMGHLNDDYMRLTAKNMGVEITGKLKICEPCAVGKSKQKSVPKEDTRLVTVPGELLYMDIAGIHEPSKGGMKYWILFVDGFSRCSVFRFAKQKWRILDLKFSTI